MNIIKKSPKIINGPKKLLSMKFQVFKQKINPVKYSSIKIVITYLKYVKLDLFFSGKKNIN